MLMDVEHGHIARDYDIINNKQQLAILEIEKKYPARGHLAEAELLETLASCLVERTQVDQRAQVFFKKQVVVNHQLANAKQALALALRESMANEKEGAPPEAPELRHLH